MCHWSRVKPTLLPLRDGPQLLEPPFQKRRRGAWLFKKRNVVLILLRSFSNEDLSTYGIVGVKSAEKKIPLLMDLKTWEKEGFINYY